MNDQEQLDEFITTYKNTDGCEDMFAKLETAVSTTKLRAVLEAFYFKGMADGIEWQSNLNARAAKLFG